MKKKREEPVVVESDTLLTEERRNAILDQLRKQGRVRVSELSRRFDISEVTIRSDLKELHQRGLLNRSHGGATSAIVASESALQDRYLKQADEKRRIGAAAAAMIADNETIILDSGTTTHEIAKHLRGKQGLQVVTNGVNILMELIGVPGIQVISVGGVLREDSFSLVGHFAEQLLEQFSAQTLFLGATACDPKFGVSTPNLAEANVNQAMVRIAQRKVLVADSTKFLHRQLCRIVPFQQLDCVVTDTGLSEALRRTIEGMGIELILA